MVQLVQRPELANTVADVGGDHGFLAIALAKQFPNKRVVYSDFSATGRATAQLNAKQFRAPSNIDFFLGDGLHTMMEKNMKCDTVIMAGVGLETIMDVVSMNAFSPLLSESREFKSVKFLIERLPIEPKGLQMVGAYQLIVQPSPPNLLALLSFYKFMIGHGWRVHDQVIDFGALNTRTDLDLLSLHEKHFRFPAVINSFVLDGMVETSSAISTDNTASPDYCIGSRMLRSWPVVQRYFTGESPAHEAELLMRYLRLQQRDLKRRLNIENCEQRLHRSCSAVNCSCRSCMIRKTVHIMRVLVADIDSIVQSRM
jgi:hypothetical protein